ncbi:DnaD domain-containing protein [Enterococcus avium]|uniref:DnaD domain-containing protein n=1 Tax=Enterococcus avium TaxID=33945 RepID=UPI0022DFD7A7|nr:DnaD domain protein [Enterococcus avium]
MDYIRQINAFENLNEFNDIGPGAQLLWYKLMRVANLSGWQKELSISNTRLQSMTKTSEKTLINNRNQLIQNGLLQYKKRGRTKAGIYILSDITGNFTVKTPADNATAGNIPVDTTVDCSVDTTVNSSVVSSVDTSAYINKTKQNKTKQSNNASESSITKNSEESAVRYWLNQVNPAEAPTILESINFWVKDFNGQDDIVILAIDEMLQNGAKSYKYLDRVLKTWESEKLDTPEKVKKHLEGGYSKGFAAKSNSGKNKQWTTKKLFDYWWAEKMGGQPSLDRFAEKYSVTEQEVGLLTEEIKKRGMGHAIS